MRTDAPRPPLLLQIQNLVLVEGCALLALPAHPLWCCEEFVGTRGWRT